MEPSTQSTSTKKASQSPAPATTILNASETRDEHCIRFSHQWLELYNSLLKLQYIDAPHSARDVGENWVKVIDLLSKEEHLNYFEKVGLLASMVMKMQDIGKAAYFIQTLGGADVEVFGTLVKALNSRSADVYYSTARILIGPAGHSAEEPMVIE